MKYSFTIDNLNFPEKEELLAIKEKFLSEYNIAPTNYTGLSYEDFNNSDHDPLKLPLVFPLLSHWLQRRGMKMLSDSQFRKRVKEVFDIDVANPKKDQLIDGRYTNGVLEKIDIGNTILIYRSVLSESPEINDLFFSREYNLFLRVRFSE